MAKEYEIKVPAHKSIYTQNPKERELNVYFCEPKNGVNEETGLVLLIAGFGGHANSNVYKKMRKEFADKYNLVTVQCDYFGYEFMQNNERVRNVNFDEIKDILKKKDFDTVVLNQGIIDINSFLQIAKEYEYSFVFKGEADLSEENPDNFNDMGIMQAIDNIYSVLYVINILLDNRFEFNAKKIIIYGYSHGAYLAYLCNLIAPSLFNLIIDNSAWIYPEYLNSERVMQYNYLSNVKISSLYDYFAKRKLIDKELYIIEKHYNKFTNHCNILSFHGSDDKLISNELKEGFCNLIANCKYIEITKNKVDGSIFKSCEHGLGADFLKMFDYVMNTFRIEFKRSKEINLMDKTIIETGMYLYEFNFEEILPKIIIHHNTIH